jgi:hypothetical protein
MKTRIMLLALAALLLWLIVRLPAQAQSETLKTQDDAHTVRVMSAVGHGELE